MDSLVKALQAIVELDPGLWKTAQKIAQRALDNGGETWNQQEDTHGITSNT